MPRNVCVHCWPAGLHNFFSCIKIFNHSNFLIEINSLMCKCYSPTHNMMHCCWNWSLNALTNTNTVQLAVLADGNDIPVCKMWLSRSPCWHHQWLAYTVHLYSKKIAPCIFCSNFNKPRSVLIIYDMIQIFKLVCNGIAHRWVFLPYLVKCSKCTCVNDHRSLFPISTLMRDSVHIV